MKKKIALLLFAIVIILAASSQILLQLRISQSQTFCKKVAQLPRQQLADFSFHCAKLYTNEYRKEGIIITNRETLNEFALADKLPGFIHISQTLVVVDFSDSFHSAAAIQWIDSNGHWKLESQTMRGRLSLYDPAEK